MMHINNMTANPTRVYTVVNSYTAQCIVVRGTRKLLRLVICWQEIEIYEFPFELYNSNTLYSSLFFGTSNNSLATYKSITIVRFILIWSPFVITTITYQI